MTDIEYIREKVDKILVQTTKTNGRVDQLEDDADEMKAVVNSLLEQQNITKGRDKTIWYVVVTLATIAGFFIAHLIEKI